MALVSLEIPAGVYRHGTDLESKNRWRDVSLVRWENNALRPIGGWQNRQKITPGNPPVTEDITVTDPARGALAWIANDGDANLAAGTYQNLYHISQPGVRTDITPALFTAGSEDAEPNIGFGGYYYGYGYYGIERPSETIGAEATSWSLDNWGEYLVACATSDRKIYEWQLDILLNAVQITNSPLADAIVVTDDRFLFALGAGTNPRKVQWCDREDNTDWTPSATNEAGDFVLQSTGQILLGINTRGRTLIVTTVDAHVAQYSGPPTVYGFERIGDNCGGISRACAVSIDEGAFWMGYNGFFSYNGSAVQEMPCDVQDYVFSDINRAEITKVYAVENSQFNEIWWFYPSGGSNENDRYVIYDYKERHWNIGQLARTAAVDIGVFTVPIWFAPDGDVYDHEIAYSHGNDLPFAETGPISIGNGERIMKITELIPDETTLGDVTLEFKTRFYPTGDESTHGPFTLKNPTGLRVQGRQVRMRIDGVNLVSWKTGTMRVNVEQGGRR